MLRLHTYLHAHRIERTKVLPYCFMYRGVWLEHEIFYVPYDFLHTV